MITDRIIIKDLLLRGIIGINEWERKKKQDILINLELSVDLSPAGSSDRIEDTVNYRTLTKAIITHVESSARYTVEALAADIAEICLGDSRVGRVTVRLEKPGALRFAGAVGITITRDRKPAPAAFSGLTVPADDMAVVALGSNVDPQINIPAAISGIRELGAVEAISPFYSNTAIGPSPQPDYVNAALILRFHRNPPALRDALRKIETHLGRNRDDDRYAPRPIDLDICFFGSRIAPDGPVVLPHPDILRFAHAAVPVADLLPDLIHPETGESMRSIAARMRPGFQAVIRTDIGDGRSGGAA